MELAFFPSESTIGPFEQGHLLVTGNQGIADSRAFGSKGFMMLAISTSDLLNGIASLYDRRDGAIQFEGIGSQFALWLERLMNGEVVVTHRKRVIHRCSDREFIQPPLQSVKDFWMTPKCIAPIESGEAEDLQMSIRRLENLLAINGYPLSGCE